MIKLDLKSRVTSSVTGEHYAYVSEPARMDNVLARLSKHNQKRLSKIAPTETDRFSSMFFDPLLAQIRTVRANYKNGPTAKYASEVLEIIGSVGQKYAVVAEVASRVSSSVKEADAFMATITADSPLLKPFNLTSNKNNLELFATLAGQKFDATVAKEVMDAVKFPQTGQGPMTGAWAFPSILSAFIARPARPLTRLETIQMVDDIIAFHSLCVELENLQAVGALNASIAMHIILDAYISLLMPNSSAMAVMHQELAGQSSIVSLDVIRRITSSFATLALTGYLAVPTLRMLHIADLAKDTIEVTKVHLPASELIFASTTQTLEMLNQVNSMAVPYLTSLYKLSGTEEGLINTGLFTDEAKFLPGVFRALMSDNYKSQTLISSIDGPLPISASIPIRIQSLGRSEYFQLATSLEKNLATYRAEVMSYNVVVSQYFRDAEIGLLPIDVPDADSIMGVPSVSMEYATPFSKPAQVRPVKYNDAGEWVLRDYINKPHNLYDLIQQIILNQPIRFVFSNSFEDLPPLGSSQGARFTSMPIPGVYAAFTERYAMPATLSTFLDLIASQGTITTRDKFFEDMAYILTMTRTTDDFIHLYRSLVPYFTITISGKDDKGSALKEDSSVVQQFNLKALDYELTAWGYPISVLDAQQAAVSKKAASKPNRLTQAQVTIVDPTTKSVLTFTFSLRNQFPSPVKLSQMRVSGFKKSVLMQPIATSLLEKLDPVAWNVRLEENKLVDQIYPISEKMSLDGTLDEIISSLEIKWLTNTNFYHSTAIAPHILLDTSLQFSEAFSYTASDITAMLSTSVIISDDSEGFSQIFVSSKVEPVMVVAHDEDEDALPVSVARVNTTPIKSLQPAEAIHIPDTTNDGQGMIEEKDKTPIPAPPTTPLPTIEAEQESLSSPENKELTIPTEELVDDLKVNPKEYGLTQEEWDALSDAEKAAIKRRHSEKLNPAPEPEN